MARSLRNIGACHWRHLHRRRLQEGVVLARGVACGVGVGQIHVLDRAHGVRRPARSHSELTTG
eukprot:9467041-Pyramimonas_sp.AAC.1